MIAVQLWAGVVFLILGGMLMLSQLRLYIRGRYFVEMHSAGVEKGLWAVMRWFWAVVWAVSATLFFFAAYWLIKYILSQPLDT